MVGDKKRTLRWGRCLALALILMVMLALGLWAWFCGMRAQLTEKNVRQVPVTQVTDKEKKALIPKYQQVERSLRQRREAEFRLSGDEVDKMIASVDRLKALRGRLSVRLDGEAAWVTVSLPLKMIPLFRNRFLNGTFKITAKASEGRLEARVLEGRNSRGKAFPKWMVKQLNELLKSPENFDYLAPGARKHLESLRIADGTMIVKLRGKR